MKNQSSKCTRTYTLLGLGSLLIPATIFGLWIYVFNMGSNQADRLELFHAYFPDFLHGQYNVLFLSLAGCVLAIVFSGKNLKSHQKKSKNLNLSILLFSSTLLLLNLFQMM